jgi:enoyl-CoA hydratase
MLNGTRPSYLPLRGPEYTIGQDQRSVEARPHEADVVITGAGRAFSAGPDIAAFQDHTRAGTPEAIAHFMRPGHRMTRRVESFPKPVIAAVNGLAFGGGCELVEATHIAIAADSATFSKAEITMRTVLWAYMLLSAST